MVMTLVRSEIYPEATIYQGVGQKGSFDIEGPTGQLGFDWLLKEVVELNFRAMGGTLLEAYIYEDQAGPYTSQWHVEILGHNPGPLLIVFAAIAGVLGLLITIKLLGWKVEDITYPLLKPVQETIQNVAQTAQATLQSVATTLAQPVQELAKGLGKGATIALAVGIPVLAIGAGVAAYAYVKQRR